jgi:predicted component of type VI protein secretion system
MPPELVALSEGPNILLDKPILLLGRHHECDIQLNSRKVSRRHCCIAQVSDYLVVRDLSSTNGIRINGKKVNEGQLKPGDELTVGNFSYRIRWPGHPLQPPSGVNGCDANGSADKPALPARLVGEDGGESLESCEQPVALDSMMDLSKRPRSARDSASESPSKSSGSKKVKMEDQPPSLILPENLELAPLSDEIPKSE